MKNYKNNNKINYYYLNNKISYIILIINLEKKNYNIIFFSIFSLIFSNFSVNV